MAYSPYVIGNPDGTTGTGATFATALQVNLNALMDGVVMGEMWPWALSVSNGTGTAQYPQFLIYTNGVYRNRQTLTYDGNFNVVSILYEHSANSGSSYDKVGLLTFTYDGSSNVTASTWS